MMGGGVVVLARFGGLGGGIRYSKVEERWDDFCEVLQEC
jgi:hypothetical protein